LSVRATYIYYIFDAQNSIFCGRSDMFRLRHLTSHNPTPPGATRTFHGLCIDIERPSRLAVTIANSKFDNKEKRVSGWKARIGYLSPSVFETPSDWDLILPQGFTIVASGLNVQAHTEAEFNKAIDALGAGLGIFAAEECDAILMGGITLGTQRGYAAEQEVVAKLSGQVGLPVSTAMSATVAALKFLKVRSTAIATAYKESINQAVKKYYEDGGLEVLAIKGLEVSKPVDQVKLPDYASYKVARELFREHPNVDSLLIQGRWRSVAYVQELEDDTGKPVVSSTAAALWWVMQVLGMKASIEGYGKLLRG
jgi:maleate isomerase